MKNITIILLLLLLGEFENSQAQDEFLQAFVAGKEASDQYNQIYENEINFCFHSAQERIVSDLDFSELNKTLLLVNYYWWQIIAGNYSKENKEELFSALKRAEKLSLGCNDQDVTYHRAIVNLYKIRASMFYQDYLSAYVVLRKFNTDCNTYQLENNSVKPDYIRLVLAINSCINHEIQNKYPVMYQMFVKQPLSYNNYSISDIEAFRFSENTLVRTECNYFLMKYYYDCFEDFNKAESFAKHLTDSYPQNYIFAYYYSNILIKNGKLTEAKYSCNRIKQVVLETNEISHGQRENFIKLFSEFDKL